MRTPTVSLIPVRAALRRPISRYPVLQALRFNSSKPTPPKPDPTPELSSSIPVPNTVPPLPLWQRLGPLTRLANSYARSQKRRPYVTQLFSSLTIYFLGDLGAQWLNNEEGEGWNWRRTGRSLVIGGVSSIPSYKWFLFLSHNFNYSSHILSLLLKIVINQSFFTPLFNTYFFSMQSLLSGDTLAQAWQRVKETVPTSCVNSCKLWPAVTAVSFTFVAVEYRSVFAGVVAIGWQTYLGVLNRRAERGEVVGGERRKIEDKLVEEEAIAAKVEKQKAVNAA